MQTVPSQPQASSELATIRSEECFLAIRIESSTRIVFPDDFHLLHFHQCIQTALTGVFGLVGAVDFSIVKFDSSTLEAILRVTNRSYVRLRSALFFIHEFHHTPCRVQVLAATTTLASLVMSVGVKDEEWFQHSVQSEQVQATALQ